MIGAQQGLFEDGYQPGEEFGPFSLGAYLSEVCRDQAPFTAPAAPRLPAAGNPAYSVLTENPYLMPAASGTCRPPPAAAPGRQGHRSPFSC